MLHSISTKIFTDKISSNKVRETKQQISTVVDKVERKQGVVYGPAVAYNYNLPPSTSNISQPKTGATDRRQIEALNEEKSHTTKETLDDIKRIHHKETKKKEQNNIEQYRTGIDPDILVIKKYLCSEYVYRTLIIFYQFFFLK